MINFELEIDGKTIETSEIENLQNAAVTYRKNGDDGNTAVSFSSDLILRGDSCKLIKDEIINTANSAIVSLPAKIKSKGRVILNGLVKGSEVEYGLIGDKSNQVTVTVHDNSNDAKATACLQNTIIWEKSLKADGTTTKGENTFRTAPYAVYFESGSHALYIIAVILKIVLLPIFGVAAIATALNGKKSELEQLLDKLENAIIQKGKHKTPYFHSYLMNLCEACNLELESELFEPNGIYHNLMRLDASCEKGSLKVDEIEKAWEKNKPNLNGVQLLDSLKSLGFEWSVRNGQLHVATKAQQGATRATWFDLDAMQKSKVVALDATVTDEVAKAYMIATYMQDSSDKVGDEVQRAIGDAVIDWNNPVNESQKGAYEHSIQYATTRFRKDANSQNTNAVDASFYRAFFAALRTDANAIIMQQGSCTAPKLLLHDATSATQNATAINHATANDKYTYQTQLHCNEVDVFNPSVATLYQNTLKYYDSRLSFANRGFSLSIIYECELESFLNEQGNPDLDLVIKYQGKTLFIEEVTVKPSESTMEITGKF